MRNAPTNSDDLIDSRDVIARIEELESEREELLDAASEAEAEADELEAEAAQGEDVPLSLVDRAADARIAANIAADAVTQWDDENGEELQALRDFASQAEGYAPDWHHGATLIRDDYFETYARELAEDLHGAEMRAASWPFSCIDWEQATSELQQDYSAVEFDGVTYWVR